MVEYSIKNVIRTNRLRDIYGDELVLTEGGREGASVYKLVLEFEIEGSMYVVLQAEDGVPDRDEPLVYRVTASSDGDYEIETIQDDEEWENISELVDEMTVSFPENP